MIKGIMYMFVRCTQGNPNNSNFVLAANDGINKEYKVGEEFEISLWDDIPEEEYADQFKLNNRIVLPEGVTFNAEEGVISGKIAHVGLYRIDVICDGGQHKFALKYVINVVPEEAELNEEGVEEIEVWNKEEKKGEKKGCFGDLATTGALIGLIALAGLGVILISFRKKEQA